MNPSTGPSFAATSSGVIAIATLVHALGNSAMDAVGRPTASDRALRNSGAPPTEATVDRRTAVRVLGPMDPGL